MKKSPALIFTVFFVHILWAANMVLATTYYVDMGTGNDLNSGTTRDKALKTIQKLADKMVAADDGFVTAGNYPERVSISKSGVAGKLITFKTEGNVTMYGFKVVADFIRIDGFTIPSTPAINGWGTTQRSTGSGIFVQGKYCEIVNNYIHDTSCIGIDIYNTDPDSISTSYCTIKNNTIVRAGYCGIYIQGINHTIEGNDISRTLKAPTTWTNLPSGADADGIRFFGSGHVFLKNKIHDIYLSDAGNSLAHIDCFQTWGPAYNIVFDSNFCSNLDSGMQGFTVEQIDSPVRDLIIKNNIIMTEGTSLDINNQGTQASMANIKVWNNTFYGTGWYAVLLSGCPTSEVFNNLFIDCGNHNKPYVFYNDTVAIGYNCHFMTDGKLPAGTPFANDLWQVNPRVKNIGSRDFHLNADSPLIDRGVDIPTVTNGYDGESRPKGTKSDIGAFEFNNTMVSVPINLRSR